LVRVASLGLALCAAAGATSCVVRAGGEIASQGSAGMELDVDRPGSDFNNFELTSPNPDLCRDSCASDGRCQAYTYVRPGLQGPNARCWLKSTVPPAVPNTCCVSGVKAYAQSVPSSPPPPVPSPPPPSAQPTAPAVRGVAAVPPPPPASPMPVGSPAVRGVAAAPPPRSHDDDRNWRDDRDRHRDRDDRRHAEGFEENTDRPGSDFQSFDLPRADPELCRRACWDHQGCRAFTFVRPGIQGANARCWLKNSIPPAAPSPCCISGVR
jgi:hypothetical protein